jgi:hypothetical protein
MEFRKLKLFTNNGGLKRTEFAIIKLTASALFLPISDHVTCHVTTTIYIPEYRCGLQTFRPTRTTSLEDQPLNDTKSILFVKKKKRKTAKRLCSLHRAHRNTLGLTQSTGTMPTQKLFTRRRRLFQRQQSSREPIPKLMTIVVDSCVCNLNVNHESNAVDDAARIRQTNDCSTKVIYRVPTY